MWHENAWTILPGMWHSIAFKAGLKRERQACLGHTFLPVDKIDEINRSESLY